MSGETLELARLRAENAMLREVGLELAQKRDLDKLLGRILSHARRATSADAGSVFVVNADGKSAVFAVAQNDSRPVTARDFVLPIDRTSLVGHCVLTAEPVHVPDAYALDHPGQGNNRWGVRHNRSFDEAHRYQTRSVLCVPMISARGDVIGVIQLINRRLASGAPLEGADFQNLVGPFSADDTTLAASLAAQAGIALENAQLYREVKVLFERFVHASVTAIEQRDPTTSGHSERVAQLTLGLARAAQKQGLITFSNDDLTTIEYAALLHDFGKVGVREAVLVKAKKLFDHEHERIQERLLRARLLRELEAERAQLALAFAGGRSRDATIDARLAVDLATLEATRKVVAIANEPSLLPQSASAQLADLGRHTFRDVSGDLVPLLAAEELSALQIEKGSLRPAERDAINAHVQNTYEFLQAIPWSRELRDVPLIAWAHHEKLNGGGYPRGVDGAGIPAPSRMLAICDIFDALTASDRPYKKAVPVARAVDILRNEAGAGALDQALLAVFVKDEVWHALPGDIGAQHVTTESRGD